MTTELEKAHLDQTKALAAEIDTVSNLLVKISVLDGFPAPFEKEFKQDFLRKNFNTTRLIIFFGIFLDLIYSIVELYLLPEWKMAVSIRLLMGIPLLIILGLCFTPIYFYLQQYFAVMAATLVIIALSTTAALISIDYKDIFYLSLMLAAFFLTMLTALQFRYTIVVCIAMMVAYNVSYQLSGMEQSQHYYWDLISDNYVLLGAAVVCLFTSYFNEMKMRKEFILNRLVSIKGKLLEYLSQIDGVTGLMNRRYLEEMYAAEWNRALRYHYPLAVIFSDFDFFKQYNDIYGHQAGDKALKSVGLVFSTTIKRAGDYVGRYGGDEFLAILSNTTLEQTVAMARQIMLQIKLLAIEHKGSKIANCITLTLGIAVLKPSYDDLPDTLIKQADLALQKGKMVQRGAIYIYTEKNILPINV